MNDSTHEQFTPPQMPSKKQQSWGALISIVIIVLMIITGAFYAWGERIAEQKRYKGDTTDMTSTSTAPSP